MAIYLGIDAGTTNLKAVLADDNGQIIASTSAPANVLTPFAGASEMDMNTLWDHICQLTLTLQAENPQVFTEIAGLAISAQGDGMWPVDPTGNPAGNAILWNDLRAADLPGIDHAALDRLLIENRSTALFPGASPLILKWIEQNQPDFFANIHRAVRCKDWLNFKLTNVLVSDYTDYSTCGINIFTKEHVSAIYDFLGIPSATDKLPPLISPSDIVGRVTELAAAQSGIPCGTPVAAGALDVTATALGAGLTKSGDGCVLLGTTAATYLLIDEEQVDVSARAGSTLCSILPQNYLRLMATLSGNGAIDWAKALLTPDLSFDALGDALRQVPVGSNGVLFHPYIGGERAPFRNPFARGGFYGLSFQHDRYDMMRAVYEGLALSLKDCYRALPPVSGNVYIAGGGAKSDFHCQMIADVLGRRVIRPDRKELAALGIVSAVKRALGHPLEDLSAVSSDQFEPNSDNHAQYNALYDDFVSLRIQMESYWNK